MTSPTRKPRDVITLAPPREMSSATVSSSWSTAPHSSTSWIVKFTKSCWRGSARLSPGPRSGASNAGPPSPGRGVGGTPARLREGESGACPAEGCGEGPPTSVSRKV
ncbi:MAG TPA: hypothetical protein VGB87_17750, partial [Vicinamibacteria bacterium]